MCFVEIAVVCWCYSALAVPSWKQVKDAGLAPKGSFASVLSKLSQKIGQNIGKDLKWRRQAAAIGQKK